MDMSTKPFTDEQKSDLLKKVQNDLPPGWAAHFSKNHVNRIFFFNRKDGKRTWEHPGLKLAGTLNPKTSRSRKRKSDEKKNTVRGSDIHTNANPEADKPASNEASTHQISKFISASFPQNGPIKTKLHSRENDKTAKTKKRGRKKRKSKTSAEKAASVIASNSLHIPYMETTIPKTDKDEVTGSSVNANTSKSAPAKEGNSFVKVPTPVIIEDIEMVEIDVTPPKKQCLIREVKTGIWQETGCAKFYFCVIDTNVLLHQYALDVIDTVIKESKADSHSTQKFTFIIPWVVLQELDHLKKSKQQARSAISFLNERFKASPSIIRGQSIFEAAAVIDGFTIENNDDRILQCCLTTMQESADDSVPILISYDKNLANKSLANGIKCFEDITDIQKIRKISPKNDSESSRVSLKICEHVKPSVKHKLDANRNIISNPVSATVQRSWEKDDLSAIYSKSRDLILPTLSFILEKEMKDAFGELWLDVVLCKPPWKMIDVLKCIRKHWLAVFKVLGVNHIIEVHATSMLSMEKKNQPNNFEFVKKWVFSAVCLIAGINQRMKYKEPVKNNLADLQKIHKSLMLPPSRHTRSDSVMSDAMKNVVELSSSSSSQDCSTIEMAEEVAKSDDFWVALDKIWTSIISHCSMMFQSLSFVPSRTAYSPEICRALTANYDAIPPRPIAVQALPFVKELVESLQASLKKFTSLSSTEKNFGPIFMDLLQTLWTTIQAFCVSCDIHSLINSHSEICVEILSSEEMIQRLKIGLHQLEVVKEVLEECLAAVLA